MRGRAGFTLIEVVVALIILTVSLGALMQLFQTGLRGTARAENRVYATLLARSRLDAIGIETPLAPASLDGDIDERFRWQAEIAPFDDPTLPAPEDDRSPAAVLYRVAVTVSWDRDGGGAVTLTTLDLGEPER